MTDDSAWAACKRVGIRTYMMARHHNVSAWTVSYWYRTNREKFDRKMAEAAVAARGRKCVKIMT